MEPRLRMTRPPYHVPSSLPRPPPPPPLSCQVPGEMLKQVRFLYESEVRRLTQRSVQRALKQMQHLQLEQQASEGRRAHEVRGGERGGGGGGRGRGRERGRGRGRERGVEGRGRERGG